MFYAQFGPDEATNDECNRIEKLNGVEDLTHCAKFMRDFGLTGDASASVLPP